MKIIEGKQYDDFWWAARRGVPTASDMKKILTPGGKPSKQSDDYALSLLGDMIDAEYPRPDSFANAAMKNGTIMEPRARKAYQADAETTVREVCFCTSDDGRFGFSPDGLCGDDGGLELKSPLPKTYLGYRKDPHTLVDDYKVQIHGCLFISGRAWWDAVAWIPDMPDQIVRVRVFLDAYTAAIGLALEAFWERLTEIRAQLDLETYIEAQRSAMASRLAAMAQRLETSDDPTDACNNVW